jgi:hypothetical protein
MNAALRDELLRMDARDQAVRVELAADGSLWKGYAPRMEKVHRENAERLREIIAKVGWPGQSLVGPDGATAAWRIAQHSIGEPDFMRWCLKLLGEASQRGDAPRWQFAMMDDRIRTFEGRPQRYGSQLRDTVNGLAPYPLEDPARGSASCSPASVRSPRLQPRRSPLVRRPNWLGAAGSAGSPTKRDPDLTATSIIRASRTERWNTDDRM